MAPEQRWEPLSIPDVIVVASGEKRMAAERAVEAVGARLVTTLRIEEAVARLADQSHFDILMVEISADEADMADTLCSLAAIATERSARIIVSCDPAVIDPVYAATQAVDVVLLCGAGPMERVGALGQAAAETGTRLTESSVAAIEADRLQRLTEEVGRIARTLAALSASEQPKTERPAGAAPHPIVSPDGIDGGAVRAMIRLRRLRDQFFPADLFADPAWDMLLDLMAARIEGRQVAVSSLCIAAAVPPTTALRWMQSMTESGLLVRKSDPIDRRRVFIALSDEAAGAMAAYFRAVEKLGGAVAA